MPGSPRNGFRRLCWEEPEKAGWPLFLMKPTHILYLHDSVAFAGAENSLLHLMRGLDPARFRPVCAMKTHPDYVRTLRELGITVNEVEFPGFKPPNPLRVWRGLKRLRRIVRETGARIVHSNTPRTNIYSGLLGLLTNVTPVRHERNLLKPRMTDTDRLFSFLPRRILCNSDAIRERFRGNPKAVTIINGVDMAKFDRSISGDGFRREFRIPSAAPVVGMTSRLEPEKGHDSFLQAARIVSEEFPECRYLIVGKAFTGPVNRPEELELLASELGIADNVVFAGFRTDMPAAYAAMDIFVLAAEAEPCGRVLFEAMAMAKPVVGTNTGGTPEIVADGRTGILFPPNDPERLAGPILDLLRAPEKRRAMGEAGLKRVADNFSIETHVRRTEGAYAALLESAHYADEPEEK